MANEAPHLLALIFAAYHAKRIHDVSIAATLNAIYHGTLGIDPRTGGPLVKPSTGEETRRYSLEVVADLVLGIADAKRLAVWRTSYGLLAGVPIDRWPPEAREYPVDDVRNPRDIARIQIFGKPGTHDLVTIPRLPGDTRFLDDVACRHCGLVVSGDDLGLFDYAQACPKALAVPPHGNLHNLAAQVDAAFCRQLGSCWSFRIDPEKIAALKKDVDDKHARAVEQFQVKGWIRKDGTEDQAAIKRSVAIAYGASGTCARCGGSGKIRLPKTRPCRGIKLRGRYQECAGAGCGVCGGSGEVGYLGDPVTCKAGDGEYRCPVPGCGELQYQHPGGGATCPRDHRATEATWTAGCDGTGLDIAALGVTLPRTDKGAVSASRDTLLESGDDDLAAFGANEYEKIRTTQIPWLITGIDRPLHYSVNPVLATGRASLEDSPAHQMTREGGERECIRARGAWCGHPIETVLGSSDYSAGELCALGVYMKYLFGDSVMLRLINEYGDPGVLHSVLGAEALGVTLEEFLKRLKTDKLFKIVRQAMKPISFGKPVAMGSPKIAIGARSKANGFTVCEAGRARNRAGDPGYHGIRFCITIGGAKSCGETKITTWKNYTVAPVCKTCVEIVDGVLGPAYFKRFPDMREYHAWGKRAVGRQSAMSQSLLWSVEEQRPVVVRERYVPQGELATFLNTPFQSMVADITKAADCVATRECYLGVQADGSPSPLVGSRIPMVSHDELVSENPLATADAAGRRITAIMEGTAKQLAPACTAWRADTALAYWLSKSMEPVVKEGKLVPWDQAKMDAWQAAHPREERLAA